VSERLPTGITLHQKSRVMEIAFSVGSYAVQPQFSDGHNTGIHSWDYVYELGENQEKLWSQYLEKLAAAGASRE
jgi:DUF971 family protein